MAVWNSLFVCHIVYRHMQIFIFSAFLLLLLCLILFLHFLLSLFLICLLHRFLFLFLFFIFSLSCCSSSFLFLLVLLFLVLLALVYSFLLSHPFLLHLSCTGLHCMQSAATVMQTSAESDGGIRNILSSEKYSATCNASCFFYFLCIVFCVS